MATHTLEDNNCLGLTRQINEKLQPLTISIGSDDNVSSIQMINSGKLEGWCWQSTAFMSVFFSDSGVVSRGDLRLPTYRAGQSDYFHSWIELVYKGKEYVFDPSLNDLRLKDDYYKEFNARIKGQVSAEQIKQSLIQFANNNNEECRYFPGSISIPGTNNMEDPFFRTNSRVVAEIKNDRVLKLHARFYFNG